jgi:L-ascorbate metabolism protein UlaG (beta-lactamase superfamily)
VSGRNKILVDPYLSDSLRDVDIRMVRGWKINKKLYTVDPNVIVLTNSHMDHTDIVSLKNYIEKNRIPITILCSESVFEIINSSGIVGRYNNVMLRHGSEWTHENLIIKSVPAMTDDKGAMGVVITDETDGKKYYIASDTLYNEAIFEALPKDIDTLFVPINGEDGSMNVYDAMRFAKVIDAVHSVPVHFGMFDDVDPKLFKCEGGVIPEIYKVIPLMDNERTELKKLSLKKVFAAEEQEMKELEKAQKIHAEVKICDEKTATSKENDVIIAENTDNCKENEPKPAIVTENKEIPVEAINEASDINEEYTVPGDPEVVFFEEAIEEEPAAEEIAEEQVEYDYLYDESFKTVEIDTAENAIAYETLDDIVSCANEAKEISLSDEYDNVDEDEVYEEYGDSEDEYEVEEYDEEYVAPSFDDFEPLSADEYVVDPSPDDFSKTGEIDIRSPEDVVEFDTPDMINDAVLVDSYEDSADEPVEEFSDEYGIEDIAALDGADSCDMEFDSIPDSEEEIDADTELIYNTDDEESSDNTTDSFGDYDDEDLSSKIDAYVKEIEKFENGDTADFSLRDFDS